MCGDVGADSFVPDGTDRAGLHQPSDQSLGYCLSPSGLDTVVVLVCPVAAFQAGFGVLAMEIENGWKSAEPMQPFQGWGRRAGHPG